MRSLACVQQVTYQQSKHAHETEINSDQDAHRSARTFEESRELHTGRAQSLGDDGDGEARKIGQEAESAKTAVDNRRGRRAQERREEARSK